MLLVWALFTAEVLSTQLQTSLRADRTGNDPQICSVVFIYNLIGTISTHHQTLPDSSSFPLKLLSLIRSAEWWMP